MSLSHCAIIFWLATELKKCINMVVSVVNICSGTILGLQPIVKHSYMDFCLRKIIITKYELIFFIVHSDMIWEQILTLKVLVTTIDAQWEGMGDVGSARYEPALLPPCPTIRVLNYSN